MDQNAGSGSMLVAEHSRCQELLRQLAAHFDHPSPPMDCCKSLLSELQSLFEGRSIGSSEEGGQRRAINGAYADSGGSSRSENSGRAAFKNGTQQRKAAMSKKRKTSTKWTSHVRVCYETGSDGLLNDGFGWRKYGQKDILRAKYPRAYYRCTHQISRGCPAIKQVQRSDDNPLAFDVTYLGVHTCLQRPQLISSQEQEGYVQQQQQQQQEEEENQLLLSYRTNLTVKTEGLVSEDQTSPPFTFPSTPISCLNPENHAFSSHSTLDNCLMGSGFSPSFVSPETSFISPATPESNYFSVSPCQMSSYGGGANLQTSESDLTEIVSGSTSAANSPMLDMDFMMELLEPDYPLDPSSFFL